MSSDQPRRRESGGSPGSPMGSTAAIIIAIVAVVAGFLILRSIGGDDDNNDSITDSTTPVDATTGLPTDTAAPVVTEPPTTVTTIFTPTVDGATAVVANSSTVNGAAGQLTTALSGKGFTMSKATNATVKQDASTVLYDPTDPEASAVAMSIAVLMGNIEVLEVSSPAPLDGGVLPDGVSIIVMLGNDKANQTLDAMSTATTTTVAGVGDTTTSTIAI